MTSAKWSEVFSGRYPSLNRTINGFLNKLKNFNVMCCGISEIKVLVQLKCGK